MFHRDRDPDRGKAPHHDTSGEPAGAHLPGDVPPAVPAAMPPPPGATLGYWQLKRGRLHSFEVPWSDARDAFARLLRTLNGEKDFTLGVPGDGLSVTVYRCRRPSSELSFQFLVTLDSGKQSDKILVEDLPDLLAFLDQLAPIIELAMKTRERAEMLAEREGSEQEPVAGQKPG